MNRLDLIQVSGKYPPPEGESDILGVEGTVMVVTTLIWLMIKKTDRFSFSYGDPFQAATPLYI